MVIKTKKGIKLWNTAKDIIPGGTQLLSKRSEMFLPDHWPSYYKRAKGVEIWDLDDNKFIDMSTMSLGTCILGYSDDDVNRAVKNTIDQGSMTTLNSPEEVELAELLLKLHPWAEMVRYSKTGGEAMAIAVRIARAYTKKDKIAFCGYHGWHDWYIAANLADNKNLDGHLLPGLEPRGVPRCLKGTALPFNYNNIEELEKIVKNNDIGVIVLEPIRHHKPENDFLQNVQKIADEIDAVLVFDEITSGWRLNIGGVHKLYDIYPDIVVYGKAISNGFPMAAIIGKADIMDKAQESFISSTYWTDKIGAVAALTTLRKHSDLNVSSHLIDIGNRVQKGWQEIGKKYGLNILVSGIPPLGHWQIETENSQLLHTIIVERMLQKGFLTSNAFYATYTHTEEHVTSYLTTMDEILKDLIDDIIEDRLEELPHGPVAHKGFKRLT